MKRAFGIFGVIAGVALLGWVGHAMRLEQISIENRGTQICVIMSVALLHWGLEAWRSGSKTADQGGAIRQIVGRGCWIICIAMIALSAFRLVSLTTGWIGFGIGVLGNLIGWGKVLASHNDIFGRH